MPEQRAIQRARADKRSGKSPSTQAGEFVKEEIDRVRSGKHGVRSAKQAIAIGLSQARRAGVDLEPPAKGKTSEATRKKAAQDTAAGQGRKKTSPSTESKAKRSRTTTAVLKRESKKGASSTAMSEQAKRAAARRPAASRSAAARKAAQTKGAAGRSAAAKKAAQTRAARSHHH
ncbi:MULTISPECIES: DUF6496 domain-containing protein [unclassified Burkholderia]|uniref:DUF6496 domain-containing protein n=1 Tax=unclassified Burkholderia TaxID=2613784 RepID=UPI00075CE7FF|nr:MULTISPECIES: DUF6496 domain-containing protein [unclassified Burkholderia]KVL39846.1 DNA-binding protein [Burkholderia sp. MSMB1835]KWE57456.1 DNA-binding protein [Burkholderia sp. MSMB2157WGS]